MIPLSAMRVVAQPVDTGAPSSAGHQTGAGAGLHGGGRSAPVAPPDMAQAVSQSGSAERSAVELAEDGYLTESTRARLEAAQRAYVAAVRAAGLNPLTNPAP